MALLTAPLEVRLRRTGTEKLVYERMSWAAYGILYVVATDLGEKAFQGDGVLRDGGLRVKRAPSYVSIAPKATARVPVACELDLPPGRYLYSLSTWEAPLRDAPYQEAVLDCSNSVERWNAEAGDTADVSLSGDVAQVQSSPMTAGAAGRGQ